LLVVHSRGEVPDVESAGIMSLPLEPDRQRAIPGILRRYLDVSEFSLVRPQIFKPILPVASTRVPDETDGLQQSLSVITQVGVLALRLQSVLMALTLDPLGQPQVGFPMVGNVAIPVFLLVLVKFRATILPLFVLVRAEIMVVGDGWFSSAAAARRSAGRVILSGDGSSSIKVVAVFMVFFFLQWP
jgi:hypothetical protein